MNNFEEKYKFIHYINKKNNNNYHKKITNIIDYIVNENELANIILYGPEGSGKYSIALEIINNYSKSNLKYEKKCNIEKNKEDIEFKLSDIHYEIDLDKLGCNQKNSFINYYEHIRDIIKSKKVFIKQNKKTISILNENNNELKEDINNKNYKINIDGIILIKNFDNISFELLNIFNSFINYDNLFIKNRLNIKYILLLKNISYIPDYILNLFLVINIPKPLLNKKINTKVKINEISNLMMLNENNKIFIKNDNNIKKMIELLNTEFINIEDLRNTIYNVLIYQENEFEFIYKIMKYLIIEKNINLNNINSKLEYFLQYYNNNYRPIFHLENLFISFYLLVQKQNLN